MGEDGVELEQRPQGTDEGRAPTVLKESAWGVTAVTTTCGVVVGLGVRLLASWVVTLPWAPMQGPAELIDSVPDPWLTVGSGVVGGLAGLVLGFIALYEALAVTVSGDRVMLTAREKPREFPRTGVAVAFKDGKHLVLLGHDGAELAREKCDFSAARLAAAFAAHGWSWAEADPYAADFRRWVPGLPGLPTGADALFTARAHALDRKDGEGEAGELRGELARIGVVVRDDDKGHQHWRLPEAAPAREAGERKPAQAREPEREPEVARPDA